MSYLEAGASGDGEASWLEHLPACAACQGRLEDLTREPDLNPPGPDASASLDASDGLDSSCPTAIASTPPNLAKVMRDLLGVWDTPLLSQPPMPLPTPGQFLGRYRVEAELGRGGMGQVYRGIDPELGRPVALKLLRAELASDGHARARFVREAQAMAQVRHDHVVMVHGVDNPSGAQPFLVLELLTGPTLAHWIATHGPPPADQVAGWFASVARGLQAVHAAGLVHRDLKPGNLMLDGPELRLKIMDFGLARFDESLSKLTQPGEVMGTPIYMPPEQARGEDVDERADIYSLGASLYEALTGVPPFRGTGLAILRQVQNEEPARPRKLNESVPRDLETVCLRAMAKEKHRRYASAADLAADLERWQRREPILARPPHAWEYLWLWARRNPRLAVMAGLVVGLATALVAGALGFAWSMSAANAEIRRGRALAEANAREAVASAEVAREQRRLALEALDALVYRAQALLDNRPGTLELRQQLLQVALDGLGKVVDEAAKQPAVDRSTIVAMGRMAEVSLTLGRSAAGGELLVRAGQLAPRHAEELPHHVAAQQTRASPCERLFNFQFQSHQVETARATAARAMEIRQRLLASDPDNAKLKRDLAVSLNKLGDLAQFGQDFPAARRHYGDALGYIRSLAAGSDPISVQTRRDLRFTLGRLGMLHAQRLRLDEAQAAFAESLLHAEELVKQDPQNPQNLRDLAYAAGTAAQAALKGDDVEAATRFCQRYIDLADQLVELDGDNRAFRRDRILSRQRLGEVTLRREQLAEAANLFTQAADLATAALHEDPNNVALHVDLALCQLRLGDLAVRRGAWDEARQQFETVAASLAQLVSQPQNQAPMLQSLLAEAQLTAQALRWVPGRLRGEALAADTPAKVADYTEALAVLGWSREGDTERAMARARAWLEQEEVTPGLRFVAVRVLAQHYRRLANDPDQAQTILQEALAGLERALRSGTAADFEIEPDLNPLRGTSEFQDLLRRLRFED